jgi:tetratricopeptide (TPR) repeat protein
VTPAQSEPGTAARGETSEPSRPILPENAQAAALAADAARTAAQAARDHATRARQQVQTHAGESVELAAARDAARAAADAAHDADLAADRARDAALRASVSPAPDATATARQALADAREARERARDAAEETGDRAQHRRAAPVSPASGLWAGFVRRVEAHRTYHRGKDLYAERRFTEAREVLAQAVALDTEHDDARALLGWTEYALGDHRAATVDFKTVLRRQPGWEGPYAGLGWSRLRLGRFVLAADAFRASLERDPGYTDATIGLGTVEFERSRYEAALAQLTPALRQLETAGGEASERAAVAANIAWSLYYLERPAEALPAFQRAIALKPDWCGLHSGMGWTLLRLGRRGEARLAFERALSLQPGYADAVAGLKLASGW